MQPDKFRYTLTTSQGDFVLKNAPEGWEETLLNYKRSPDYFGLIRSFTVPMTFVLDGAWLLRREFYSRGINANTVLKIEALRNRDWTYRLVYSGEVDFVEFKDVDQRVTVNVTDVGVAESVASSDKAVYEIPLDDAGAVLVEIPSISLIDFAQNLIDPKPYNFSAGFRVLPNSVQENQLINEKVTLRIAEEEAGAILSSSPNHFLEANEDTSVVISGRLEGATRMTRFDYTAIIEIRNQNSVIKGTVITAPRRSERIGISYSLPVNMVSGEKLFLVLRFINGSGSVEQFTVDFFSVRVTNEVLSPPSQAKAFPAFRLFEILLERMNGAPVPCDSTLLKASNLFITCGDAIREFETAVIKTSFTDFYKSVDAVLGCGFGLDGGFARLEAKEFFFREVPAVNLGTVKSLDLSVAEQFLFNALKIGYKENNYEENQGREEFNQGQNWLSPIKKVDSLLERISVYRADQFGIATLRRLTILDNLQNKDTESDNSVFFLQGSGVEIDGVHKLETGADYTFIGGLSNQQNAFNLNLSPKRCLLRSGSYLSIGLHRYENQLLRFGSSEKNADIVTEKGGMLVFENQDIAISALRRRLFLPYLVKVTVDLPKDSWSLIDQNLFGFFTFIFEGQTYRGFIEESSNDIGSNTERDISLYLHPETNIQNLIR